MGQLKLKIRLEFAIALFVEKLIASGNQNAITLEDDVEQCLEALKSGTLNGDTPEVLYSNISTFMEIVTAGIDTWDEEIYFKTAKRKIVGLFAPAKKSAGKCSAAKRLPANKCLDSISFGIPDFSEESAPPAEDVSFTAIYPREIGVETWNTLLVYVHLASAVENIRKDSERFKDQITSPKEVTAPASTPLARGTELTIVPQCEGVTFNPQRITLAWLEDFHRADFRFRTDKSLADDAARGRIDIYVGPLIVGTLKLAILVGETAPQETEPQEDHATMYQQDDIFISYSHKDSDIALAFKKAYDALGHNVLIDIDTLRSGQDWNAELMKMIGRAEIFQLFWSENSSQSKYCREEWEYALKLNRGLGFIRPCYFKMPMPPPPEELGHLHFEFVQV